MVELISEITLKGRVMLVKVPDLLTILGRENLAYHRCCGCLDVSYSTSC